MCEKHSLRDSRHDDSSAAYAAEPLSGRAVEHTRLTWPVSSAGYFSPSCPRMWSETILKCHVGCIHVVTMVTLKERWELHGRRNEVDMLLKPVTKL